MQKKLNINESFICKIWEAGELYYSGLLTTEGEKVEVLELGTRNFDSGPDYKNSRIRIGGKLYTGSVEVHRDFQGWEEHKHPKDRNYNVVILQVVLWDSSERKKPKLRIHRELQTVILSKFLNRSIHEIWQEIINNPSEKFKLPCYDSDAVASADVIRKTFSILSIERLKLKTLRIRERFQELHRESGKRQEFSSFIRKSKVWEQVLYEFIFEALGYSKNKEPMLKLAKNLSLSRISKIIAQYDIEERLLIQTLLHGCGGFLFDLRNRDEYIDTIKETWGKIKPLYRKEQVSKAEWKFFRLRPQNFPSIRISYGSQLILKLIKENLFREIVLSFQTEKYDVNKCRKFLHTCFLPEEDEYWSTHYYFGKKRSTKQRLIGIERLNDIIINVLIPVVYYYSIVFNNDILTKNVLQFYNKLKIHPENTILNVIRSQILNKTDVKIDTPSMEQAAIQLYNFYCMHEKCSECAIGEGKLGEKGFDYRIIFY